MDSRIFQLIRRSRYFTQQVNIFATESFKLDFHPAYVVGISALSAVLITGYVMVFAFEHGRFDVAFVQFILQILDFLVQLSYSWIFLFIFFVLPAFGIFECITIGL